ncbi:MAG: hypothetical protein IJ458_00045 [Clostridia bacterium]|nr:hypothetical protein [Clostridia bacterium]
MKKKVIVSLLILIVAIMCCGCGIETEQKIISNNSSYEKKDDYINDVTLTVWVTKYGERYHVPGCGHVKKVYRKLTVKQAKLRGYTPCFHCCY